MKALTYFRACERAYDVINGFESNTISYEKRKQRQWDVFRVKVVSMLRDYEVMLEEKNKEMQAALMANDAYVALCEAENEEHEYSFADYLDPDMRKEDE